MNDYDNYEDWKQWAKETFGTCSSIDAAYFSAELKRAGIETCAGVRFYEIGFGNGAFAGYVHANKGEYYGSELNTVLVSRAREFGVAVFDRGIKEALETENRGMFDVVVAFDVLEHFDIAGIKDFLLDALILLKPGGIVLARVPSGDSPFGRAIFHGDITHESALGSSAVRQLASQTDFEVMDIGSPKLPIWGVGFIRSLRRLGIHCARTIITWSINLIFHDGQPRVITSNLVFVLRKSFK